jgi:hypothetical protein
VAFGSMFGGEQLPGGFTVTHRGPDSWTGSYPVFPTAFPVGFGSSGGFAGGFGLVGLGLPNEAYSPVTKGIVASILASLGYGDFEQGVYDTPQPVIYPVLSERAEETSTVTITDDLPEFLPGWPEEWKKQPGEEPGWIEDQWVYPEEQPVAFWDGVSAVVDIMQGQTPGGNVAAVAQPMQFAPMGSPVPASFPAAAGGKVTVDTKTGKVTPCRRRRRRRLLTPTDLNDLAALKTIVGGGQAINFAVMKAVRR